MKPEIYKFWEEALSCLENAEKLLIDKKSQEAVKQADSYDVRLKRAINIVLTL